MKVNISLIGLGNVGKKILEILKDSNEGIKARSGEKITVVSASDSRYTVFDQSGMDVGKLLEAKLKGDIRKSGYSEMLQDEIFSLKTDAIVDVSAATADGIAGRDLYLRAFRSGKDIVTANKAPLALHWESIMEECRASGRRMKFESTVAGGVPLFNLRDYSIIPSEVLEFRGVVSSSVNIIMKDVMQGKSFDDSVQYAIKQGIAEANYHDDTLGLDAARKTVILANALFGTSLTLADIQYEGVEDNESKVKALAEKGGEYKVVSNIRRDGMRVSVSSSIQEIRDDDPLKALGDESLGYTVRTDKNGEVLVVGIEDTPIETASGVVNDIALLSKTLM